ncbi:MAG: DUF5050 domain-containing protein [Clostridia bacterium]
MKEKLINFKDAIVNFFNTNKKIALIILAVILVLVIMLIIIGNGKEEYGNTYGNLRNKGLVASKGSQIYYVAFDEGNVDGIYKAKKNGKGKAEKISSEYGYYLNISGNYIYYVSEENSQLIKAKLNGEKNQVIAENVSSEPIVVVDNWIYYFEGTNLYKIKTNGKNRTQLSNKAIENYQVVGKEIYYSYESNGKYVIAKMNLSGKDITKIDEEAGREFFVKGNKIYFINEKYDMENYEYKYELCKMKTNGKNKEKVCDIGGGLDTYTINFTNDALYYAKAVKDEKMAIYSIKLNGKNETKIVEVSTYSNAINIVDKFMYYINENEDGYIQNYRIKTNGENNQAM